MRRFLSRSTKKTIVLSEKAAFCVPSTGCLLSVFLPKSQHFQAFFHQTPNDFRFFFSSQASKIEKIHEVKQPKISAKKNSENPSFFLAGKFLFSVIFSTLRQ